MANASAIVDVFPFWSCDRLMGKEGVGEVKFLLLFYNDKNNVFGRCKKIWEGRVILVGWYSRPRF